MALARAIETRMLLLDRPSGARDARLRRELRAIHDSTGLTTVVVIHAQDEATELAEGVVVMPPGPHRTEERPASIRARPATEFVRDVIPA